MSELVDDDVKQGCKKYCKSMVRQVILMYLHIVPMLHSIQWLMRLKLEIWQSRVALLASSYGGTVYAASCWILASEVLTCKFVHAVSCQAVILVVCLHISQDEMTVSSNCFNPGVSNIRQQCP